MLTTAWKLAGLAVAIIVAAVLVVIYNAHVREDGKNQAEKKRLSAELAVVRKAAEDSAALFRKAAYSADSLRGLFRTADHGGTVAAGRTDTARAALASARDSALTVARNANATAEQLRASLFSLAKSSDSAQAAWLIERDQKNRALIAARATIESDSAAIRAGVATVRSQVRTIAVLDSSLTAERKGQPGVVARGSRGVIAGVAGVACAAGGQWIAGPIAAVAGFVVCSFLGGAIR